MADEDLPALEYNETFWENIFKKKMAERQLHENETPRSRKRKKTGIPKRIRRKLFKAGKRKRKRRNPSLVSLSSSSSCSAQEKKALPVRKPKPSSSSTPQPENRSRRKSQILGAVYSSRVKGKGNKRRQQQRRASVSLQ